jgi:predicted enzyme related to lactoylglutathione lyase
VADAAAAVKKLETLGAKVREALQNVGEDIKVAVVADPFGNSFGVIENPNFKPDKMR